MDHSEFPDFSFTSSLEEGDGNQTSDSLGSVYPADPSVTSHYPFTLGEQMDEEPQPSGFASVATGGVYNQPTSEYDFHTPLSYPAYHEASTALQPDQPTRAEDYDSSRYAPISKREFSCPVFEADTVLGRTHSCPGAKEERMSEIRRHMTRGREPHLQFLRRCTTCEEDIIDQQEYNSVHGQFCNTPQKQRRGAAAEQQWNALYTKVNPPGTPLPVSNINYSPALIATSAGVPWMGGSIAQPYGPNYVPPPATSSPGESGWGQPIISAPDDSISPTPSSQPETSN